VKEIAMAAMRPQEVTHERTVPPISGWLMLAVGVALIALAITLWLTTIRAVGAAELEGFSIFVRFAGGILLVAAAIFIFVGMFTLQPNEARVLILFGSYKGTIRSPGFHWANPFYSRSRGTAPARHAGEATKGISLRFGSASASVGSGQKSLPTKISLRAHNFNSDKLKVNDKRGNPVEIAAVIVWRVADTAQAVFDVEDYDSYVEVQSEAAIRSIASLYAYDDGEEGELTLRGGGDQVSQELGDELRARLATAGVHVEDARLTHLAYAPEIASAMLRRQQAEAVIAARVKIVAGAVSMVEMALQELDAKGVVQLDEERKAAMVSNLLVVLCGTSEASPVINTGTLYN
jgi:regulator of protease activity HflC (stomatin/prohibitin superfamily)